MINTLVMMMDDSATNRNPMNAFVGLLLDRRTENADGEGLENYWNLSH
jgi:hypothetical protein